MKGHFVFVRSGPLRCNIARSGDITTNKDISKDFRLSFAVAARTYDALCVWTLTLGTAMLVGALSANSLPTFFAMLSSGVSNLLALAWFRRMYLSMNLAPENATRKLEDNKAERIRQVFIEFGANPPAHALDYAQMIPADEVSNVYRAVCDDCLKEQKKHWSRGSLLFLIGILFALAAMGAQILSLWPKT